MSFRQYLLESDLQSNILHYYNLAGKEEINAGLSWYKTANEICQEIGKFYHEPVEHVAGIMAALSPRVKWKVNIRFTGYFFHIVKNGKERINLGFSKNSLRAYNMYDTKSFVPTTIKTYDFYKSILGDSDSAVVDIWAMRVALNQPKFQKTFKPDHYKIVQRAYIDAAKHTDLLPSELQAITWTVIRNNRNIS